MRARFRGRLTYANVMASVAVFIALGGGAYAATNPFVSSKGIVSSCVSKRGGALRVIKAGKRCPKKTVALSFNQTGPQGPQGSMGQQGPAGITGQTKWGNVLVEAGAADVVLAKVGPFTISAHCSATGEGSELLTSSSVPAQTYGEDSGHVELKAAGESAEIGDDEDYDEAFYAWSPSTGVSINGNTFLWNKGTGSSTACEFQGSVIQTS